MFRRSRWLFPTLVLLFSVTSSAGKDNRAFVEGVDVPVVVVKRLKVPKASIEIDAPADVIVKAVKTNKMPVGSVDLVSVDSREMRVVPIKLEGIEELPKKLPKDDEDDVNHAVKKAEREQGAAGAEEGSRMQTEGRAETEAAVNASQDAVNRGDSKEETADVAEAARKRVREDYARAADGGPLEAPAPEPERAPAAAPASGEAGPEVLEPPPKEAPEAGEGDEPAPAPEPAVVDVPAEQP